MRKHSRGNARGGSLNAYPELSNDDQKPVSSPRALEKNNEIDNNSRGSDEKDARTVLGWGGNERSAFASRAAPTWLEETQVTRLDPSGEPHMNLDEFVTSLARTNCFPAEDKPTSLSGNGNACMGNAVENSQSSTVHSDDPDFRRLSGGSSTFVGQSSAELDTSLRLGPMGANEESNKLPALVSGKNKAVADTQEDCDEGDMRENFARGFYAIRRDNRKGHCTADATMEGPNVSVSPSPDHDEVCRQYHIAGCASVSPAFFYMDYIASTLS